MRRIAEDTLQVMGEIRARMEDIRLSLIELGDVSALIPESKRGDIQQQLIELQREGLRLGRLYMWLVKGIQEDDDQTNIITPGR